MDGNDTLRLKIVRVSLLLSIKFYRKFLKITKELHKRFIPKLPGFYAFARNKSERLIFLKSCISAQIFNVIYVYIVK